jgi:hypothetical protein
MAVEADGFKSTAGDDRLGAQFGNVATTSLSSPGGSAGSAATSGAGGSVGDGAAWDENAERACQGLQQVAAALEEGGDGASERAAKEGRAAVSVLVQLWQGGQLSQATAHQVMTLAAKAYNADYQGAAEIQAALARTEWSAHKKWLQPLASFLQGAVRRQQSAAQAPASAHPPPPTAHHAPYGASGGMAGGASTAYGGGGASTAYGGGGPPTAYGGGAPTTYGGGPPTAYGGGPPSAPPAAGGGGYYTSMPPTGTHWG